MSSEFLKRSLVKLKGFHQSYHPVKLNHQLMPVFEKQWLRGCGIFPSGCPVPQVSQHPCGAHGWLRCGTSAGDGTARDDGAGAASVKMGVIAKLVVHQWKCMCLYMFFYSYCQILTIDFKDFQEIQAKFSTFDSCRPIVERFLARTWKWNLTLLSKCQKLAGTPKLLC